MAKALVKLARAQQQTKSLLSIGLEPAAEYLPKGFSKNLEGYEEFLRTIIEATEGLAAAYKVNLAFFESHGWEGVELLYTIREMIPDDIFFIADAKRSDIGTSAKHYAKSLFDQLGADAATVNPLMGTDSAEPFLAYKDKLTYFLVLTSNPGAKDFLLKNNLYLEIAEKVAEWNDAGNCGFVAGATQAARLGGLRQRAPAMPLLVPGAGAQGGDADEVLRQTKTTAFDGTLLLHLSRGILPTSADKGGPAEIIRHKTEHWRAKTSAAIGA